MTSIIVLGNMLPKLKQQILKNVSHKYRVYRKAGLIIIEIHCDNEFHKAMDNFTAAQDSVINMNYANAKEHVPRVERNNRTIRERVRASYYQMPYKHLPRILVKYMVSEAARKLNYFR